MRLLRSISGPELVKALRALGYVTTRQKRSHIRVTTQRDGENHETIPNHRPIKPGLLHGILKHVASHHRLTMEELLKLLEL